MAGFNAETAIEKLEWDFRPFVDAHGVIPEPSEKQVDEFWERLGDATATETKAEALKALEKMSSDERLEKASEIGRRIASVMADLCQQCPSAEQVEGLPHRQKQAFYGWVVGQLANPT